MTDLYPNRLGSRPSWLTFDCYGTLVQWHETVGAALARPLAAQGASDRLGELTAAFRRRQIALETGTPHRLFRDVVREALLGGLADLGLEGGEADADGMVEAVSAVPPFPEVPGALRRLKAAGFGTCAISNSDRATIAGTMDGIGPGLIDRVVTAEEAGAYKPSPAIFERAWSDLGVERRDVFHIAVKVRADLTAARDLGFRAAWIDRNTGEDALPDYTPIFTVTTLDGVVEAFAAEGWMEA